MTDRVDEHLEERIIRLIDGELGEAEAAELERELLRNPAAARLKQEYEQQNETVKLALEAALTAPSGAERTVAARRTMTLLRWTTAAAAAAIVLGGLLWFALPAGKTPGTPGPIGVADSSAGSRVEQPEALDAYQPPAEPEVPVRRVRHVDRFYVDFYDEQRNEIRRVPFEREQVRIVPVAMSL